MDISEEPHEFGEAKYGKLEGWQRVPRGVEEHLGEVWVLRSWVN